jgi:sirohydrochlorin cobaltochelatase
MRTVLAECIEETLENSGKTTLDYSNTTLILVGHGTTKNENSGAEVINMADQIRREGVYASVLHAFMEESPYDHEVLARVKTGQVIIVPYFVSEGFHTRDEIPQRMGLLKASGNNLQNPVIISPTLTAWYTRAVGTHPAVDDIVLARVKESQTSHGRAGGCKDPSSISNTPKDSGKKSWCVGELLIEPHPEGYAVRHAHDAEIPASQLEVIEPIEKLHNLSRFDIDGAYRPLRSAAGLRSGWIFCAASIEELELALDFVLPNAWRHQRLWLRKELIVRSYRETTARQSGIYAATAGLTKAEVQEVARECCKKTCQRTPVWPVEKNETAPVLPMELGSSREQLVDQGLVPCPELCSWAMEMARRKSEKTER